MADAVDSKSTDGNIVGVQVPSRAVYLIKAYFENDRLLSGFFVLILRSLAKSE